MCKFYCFNCQKEVTPKKFFRWRFCPLCQHKIIDSGEGLYLICNNCGANNQVNAKSCVKCGNGLNGGTNSEVSLYKIKSTSLIQILIDALIIIGALAFSILVLYVSFYLVFAFFVLGVIYYLFSKINPHS